MIRTPDSCLTALRAGMSHGDLRRLGAEFARGLAEAGSVDMWIDAIAPARRAIRPHEFAVFEGAALAVRDGVREVDAVADHLPLHRRSRRRSLSDSRRI